MPFLLALTASVSASAKPLVAVIDSGVARTGALSGVVVGEYDMAGSRPAFQPRYDHGTMVATIIDHEAQGGVDIVSLRIDDPAGCPAHFAPPCQPSSRPIAAAIDKAVDLGVDAINLSLALADDPAITEAVRRASAKGIIVVMAAGNNGRNHPDNTAMARAGFPRAVLVGATDMAGNPWTGTNRPDADDYLYVWRQGVDVPTVSAAGQKVFGTGTSFAAPIETARRVLAKGREVAALQGTH
ncbi:S8 family serine peptidase [Sphingomonas tabacisoli]|uniref:S8 family serine peptidase n=1 Tax=Sphingomonas tabacisoli TaxID=2249466 RepID=A0ABW4I0Z3_9SPHN